MLQAVREAVGFKTVSGFLRIVGRVPRAREGVFKAKLFKQRASI